MQKPLLFVLLLLSSVAMFSQTTKGGGVVVLFDNDVHCAINGYAAVAGYKDSLLREGNDVVVVSCGDFVSGSSFGAISKGEYPVCVVNTVGYDYVALGNHEFDYGLSHLQHLCSMLTPRVLCCNFRSCSSNKSLFAPWAIYHSSATGIKLAFVGIATPSTVASTSSTYFKNSRGEYLYTFGKDSLFAWVQEAVDSVRRLGADYVVLLSHLGDADDPPTSLNLIEHISGADVLLDGHSHNVIEAMRVADRQGDSVLLCSTGSGFQHVGMLNIAPTKVSSTLLPANRVVVGKASKTVVDTIMALSMNVEKQLRRNVGISNVTLRCDNDEGHRLVRMQEMPLGNLCADAFRMVLQADIGWVNGGGIRSSINAGVLTYNDILSVFPFGNKCVVVELTGQDLLDALEMACRLAPYPYGAFPQVSGIRVVVDTMVAAAVEVGKEGIVKLTEGRRRISKVEVWDTAVQSFIPLDTATLYRLASTTYTLCNMGDGIPFPYRKQLETTSLTDAELLEQYIVKNLHGVVPSSYSLLQRGIVYR